jgi:hypothetical protein
MNTSSLLQAAEQLCRQFQNVHIKAHGRHGVKFSPEGLLSCEHGVQHDAEAVDVTGSRHAATAQHLRQHTQQTAGHNAAATGAIIVTCNSISSRSYCRTSCHACAMPHSPGPVTKIFFTQLMHLESRCELHKQSLRAAVNFMLTSGAM